MASDGLLLSQLTQRSLATPHDAVWQRTVAALHTLDVLKQVCPCAYVYVCLSKQLS